MTTPGIGTITTPVTRPKGQGYNIRIGSKWYRTVAGPQAQVQLGSRDSLAERWDQSGSIYNNVLDIGYAWSRTDVSGGEGLDWDPREIALDTESATKDVIRFFDSNGLDIARPEKQGDQYSIKLARDFDDWSLVVADPRDMTETNPFIYVADGETVSWYESWDNLTPIGTDIPAPGFQVRAMAAAPNDTVMVTCFDGNAYVKPPNATSFSVAYTDSGGQNLQARGIWYVNGRFVLSVFDDIDVAELRVIEWDGTDWQPEGAIDTATSAFLSVVESGPAVVAACGDGTVRTYTPDNGADGDMSLHPMARTTMPEGEQPILLGSNGGILLIFTSQDLPFSDTQSLRIYQAEVLDERYDFSVGQMRLRREWNGREHEPDVKRAMTNTRDEIYFFVKEVASNGLFYESLWRFDIVSTGLNRVWSAPEETSNMNAMIIFDGFWAGIDFTAGVIRIADPFNYQAAGYMTFPNITFGLNTEIAWISSILEAHDLLDLGAQVELWRSTKPQAILDPDDPSWVLVQRLSSQGASNLEVPFTGLKSRTLSLQLRMRSTIESLVSPKVTRVALRGIPAHRDFIMMVPIDISDYLSVPGRAPQRIPGLGHSLHSQVLELVGASVQATLLDPPINFDGVVNNVSEPIDYLSERGSVTRHVMVEFRGTRTSSAAQFTTGDNGIGLGLLGISTVGIGQSGQE